MPMEEKRTTELRRSKRISNSTNATASLDWSKFPDDLMAKILSLTPDQTLLDILLKWLKYQRVCKTWQRVFRNLYPPMRWRTIDFKFWDAVPISDLVNLDVDMIYHSTIDRSCGQLVDITLGCEHIIKICTRSHDEIAKERMYNRSRNMTPEEIEEAELENERYKSDHEYDISEYINNSITDELLDYMTERCRGIRRLGLVRCEKITEEGLRRLAAASRLTLLEDLQISGYFTEGSMQVIARSCPLLKSFRFIKSNLDLRKGFDDADDDDDDHTIAIARTMPGLHNLELGKFKLTNNAIKEIVDGCPHLESLDLEQVQMLDGQDGCLDKNLGNRITKEIKKFKPPGIRRQI